MPDQYTQLPLIATEKRCSKCREMKPLSAFHRHPRARGGLQPACKACHKIADAAYRLAVKARDPEHFARRQRVYYEANRERVLVQNAAYHDAHAEEINAKRRPQRREYYQRTKETTTVRVMAYRRANPEKQALWDTRRRAREITYSRSRAVAAIRPRTSSRLAFPAIAASKTRR